MNTEFNLIAEAYLEESTNDLIYFHNMTEDKLISMDKLGGMPAPSIGITKVSIFEDSFGNVTLIGKKNLINFKSDKVYTSDAYTSRFPDIVYKPDFKLHRTLMNKWKSDSKLYRNLRLILDYSLESGGNKTKYAYMLKTNPYAIWMFRHPEKPINDSPSIKVRKLSKAEETEVDELVDSIFGEAGFKKGSKWMPLEPNAILSQMKANTGSERDTMHPTLQSASGSMAGRITSRTHLNSFVDLIDKEEPDTRSNFESEMYQELFGIAKNIPSKNKYADIIVVLDQLGRKRYYTPNAIKKEISDEFNVNVDDVPDDVVTQIQDVIKRLSNRKRSYLEAKPRRILNLDMFAFAVVTGKPVKIIRDIFKKHNVKVYFVDTVEEKRTKINEIADVLQAKGTPVYV